MQVEGTSDTRQHARRLRREMTLPEVVLWQVLRRNPGGLRFRRQHPAGPYVLDFFCAKAALVVEVDGEAHGRGDRPLRDANRDTWLTTRGLLVVRYPASAVLRDTDGVVRQLLAIALDRLPGAEALPPSAPSVGLRPPPPPGGGG